MPLRNLQLHLLDLPTQQLLVEVQGSCASRIRRGLLDDPSAIEALPDLSELTGEQPAPEPPLADVVELFLRGLETGLFLSASQRPWSSQGELLADEIDETRQLKRWRLSLQDVHPGAFRVLRNLLRALQPDRVLLGTLQGAPGGRPLTDLATLPYPPQTKAPPGRMIVAPSLADRPCQAVRLTLRDPLDELKEREVMTGFDRWAHLLMLGGYQEDRDADKGRLAAAPNPPSLADSYTVEMTFELFNSAPAALDAFVNMAHRLHQTKFPVESLEFE
jgi:hypothetical protein